MLAKPDLPKDKLISCLQDEYDLTIEQVEFLPVGADRHTAVYRVVADGGKPHLAKLRTGVFDQVSVAVPRFLHDQGIAQIIAPLPTKAGHLWTSLESFKLMVYPFIEGANGYEANLSRRQWRDLGAALRRIHATTVPLALGNHIKRETHSPQWRKMVKTFLTRAGHDAPGDPLSAQLTALLRTRHDQISDLVERAQYLAQALELSSPEFVLCHADLHAGNVLVDASGSLYIVDWDDPVFAPKERDLMFIGGGHFGHWRTAQEEESLFYQGYGTVRIDAVALAYYRYERIVEDIAVFCQRILLGHEGHEDREQSLRYLASNFLTNSTIEQAYRSDPMLNDA